MKISLSNQDFTGKPKREVFAMIGNEYNHYLSDLWSYDIKKNWLGKKTILNIHFKNDKVYKVEITKTYEKTKH